MILKQKSRPTFSIWTFLGCPFSKNFLDFLKMGFLILYNKCPEGLKDAPPTKYETVTYRRGCFYRLVYDVDKNIMCEFLDEKSSLYSLFNPLVQSVLWGRLRLVVLLVHSGQLRRLFRLSHPSRKDHASLVFQSNP